jgi:SAM-dependent methyltransferase
MAEQQIRYDDAAYERMMGAWSRIAGEIFLDWLAPDPSLRWIEIGCGSGAFTELLVERCAPAEVQGIDASEAQLSRARTTCRSDSQISSGRRSDASFWRRQLRCGRYGASDFLRSRSGQGHCREGSFVQAAQSPPTSGI